MRTLIKVGGPLLAFVLLGVVAGMVVNSSHGTLILLFLVLAPLLVIGIPIAFAQCARSIPSFLKAFTWWQWLWFLLFISGLIFRTRDVHEIAEQPLDAWALFRIVL